MSTFRKIRPLATFGVFAGDEKSGEADVVFASIQTLGRYSHLKEFAATAFDYIVVDEFHHAAAKTYRKLIEYFDPKFLLGLTATPERTDGGDLLSLCSNNLVYRCDLPEGIRRGLLSSFSYFGVPDEVDYTNIPWRSAKFDEQALTSAVATETRARNALEQHAKRGGKRTLAFCCSKSHADFMSSFFAANGLRTVAIHSGPTSAPRASSLEALEKGDLDVVFAVDMFNEGVDLPDVDTILMLRPTESRILWLQQFGRGLRKVQGKILTVIDYIGNHRIFLLKPISLLGLEPKDSEISLALERVLKGKWDLPPGCEVTYELEAVNILRSLLRRSQAVDLMKLYFSDFRERNGVRPTASEAYNDGYSPRNVRNTYGSWLGFVRAMDVLNVYEERLVASLGGFFEMLETTEMSKSYKMVTILAMLAEGSMPGSIRDDQLVDSFATIVNRNSDLRRDVSIDPNDRASFHALVKKNPIQAWAGNEYFNYSNGILGCNVQVPETDTESFQQLVREIVDWRLLEYLRRPGAAKREPQGSVPTTGKAELWTPYMREAIPGLFGLAFSVATWNVGFLIKEKQAFMLVTLENSGFADNFKYTDKFLSPDTFQWQSQNRTVRDSNIGRQISKHLEMGLAVQLFVRPTKKIGSNAAPFYYCGEVIFESWEGDSPITIRYKLKNPVPASLHATFGIQ